MFSPAKRAAALLVAIGCVICAAPPASPAATVLGLGPVVGGPVWSGDHVLWVQRGPGGRDRLLRGAPGEPTVQVHFFDAVQPAEYVLSASSTHVAVVRNVYGAMDHFGDRPQLQADTYVGPTTGPLQTWPTCHNAYDIGPYAQISGSVLATSGCGEDSTLTLTNLTTGAAIVRPVHELEEVQAAGPYVAYGNFDEEQPNRPTTALTVLDAETGQTVYALKAATELPFLPTGFQLKPSGSLVSGTNWVGLCGPSVVASIAHPHLTPVPGLCDLLTDGEVDGDRILMVHLPGPSFDWIADFAGRTVVPRLPAHEEPGGPNRLAVHGDQIAYAGLSCHDDPLIVASLTDLPPDRPLPVCNPRLLARPRLVGRELRLRLTCPNGCAATLAMSLVRPGRALRPRLAYVTTGRHSDVTAPTGRHRRFSAELKPGQRRVACRNRLTLRVRSEDRFDHERTLRYEGRRRVPLLTPDC